MTVTDTVSIDLSYTLDIDDSMCTNLLDNDIIPNELYSLGVMVRVTEMNANITNALKFSRKCLEYHQTKVKPEDLDDDIVLSDVTIELLDLNNYINNT